MEIVKTVRMGLLHDFYGPLLTPKQRSCIQLYYEADLSLAETAEKFGSSRQAVYDLLKRTEKILEEYESKLGLLKKYEERQKRYTMILEAAKGTSKEEEIRALVAELERIETADV
jgi:predicted DNA-binding protein YlxM (UPF0122 family)